MDLVDRIEEIRTRNNSNWMMLLRLALQADPDGARAILRDINDCDSQVTRLLRELADEDPVSRTV